MMIMNKNDKNTPSSTAWIDKLFKRPRLTGNIQGKHYFVHRYHAIDNTLSQNPFHILFSDTANVVNSNPSHCLPAREDITYAARAYSSDAPMPLLNQGYGNHHLPEANLNTPFTVLNCYDETPDTRTFRLGRLNAAVFNFLPGQYVTLSVLIDGKEYKRSYSLASVPSSSGIIEITVKRDPNGGVVSNWLNSHLKIGDKLSLKGPYGKFTFASNAPANLLFLAAGSGIVPIMSMLRWLTHVEAKTEIVALLSFRTFSDIIYRRELDLIATRHPNVKLFITLTQEFQLSDYWQGSTGRIDKNIIAALVPNVREQTVYLCGPDAFMAGCKQHLSDLSLPHDKIHCEHFTIDNTAVSNQQDDSQKLCRKAGNYRVKFVKSGISVRTDGMVSLLELAEKSGIKISHDCRSGECGECMVKYLKGDVDMTQHAEISELDRKKGWVFACCAYPVSNIVLDV
jgi:glycine betaine catabolism B